MVELLTQLWKRKVIMNGEGKWRLWVVSRGCCWTVLQVLLILLSVTGVQDGGGEAPGDPELEPAEPKQPKLSENDKIQG